MIIISEAMIAALMNKAQAFVAVEKTFASMARRGARNFPVIREAIGHADALYGFKSGFDREALNLGVKAGGYWPGNVQKGLTNHQSTIFLFDADTGKIRAVIGGNLLTALRTAAAAAVSVAYLARKDAKVLGIIGAGHQAKFQLEAIAGQRKFEKIVAWNRTPEKLTGLAAISENLGLPFQSVSLPELGAQSDVIVTITSSFVPILKSMDVKPGTHIACMGTDTKGKQEVETALLASATVFTDEIAQAVSIGECQHAVASGILKLDDIKELGSVIIGDHIGRSSDDEITVYDGTGVALQDLAVANMVLETVIQHGPAHDVPF